MVHLIELFTTYIKWKILAQFLSHPNTSFYVKEMARSLDVSPGSVSTALKSFEEWGLLTKEERGQTHLYKLNLEHASVPSLKRAYGLALVLSSRPAEKFLDADGDIVSIALFGSYADGSFDELSDVDFLIVAPSKKGEIIEAARRLEDEMGRKVSVSPFKLSDWRQMAKREDTFYKRVIENHVLLHGGGLR
ncbi:nucleotidyltransferase domain-containing protein [Candidatus Bathyarchaeota archaeon]|nr:nucleotidyltransferase domain-containing protein [Candidatus Bathyarchaeota archaeon]